ncbi:hypothetical protein ADUPG1_012342 [Aduncisulcus paluster]|uniref:Uncharacterized protein n=1 Tax=Aduncisulcus paluster TaxID=2918883 RepID=A0ABQ5K2F9_9EUKA|nr:hypothetical protein ADUPG1_012342 [Aduncisulcus paluster]
MSKFFTESATGDTDAWNFIEDMFYGAIVGNAVCACRQGADIILDTSVARIPTILRNEGVAVSTPGMYTAVVEAMLISLEVFIKKKSVHPKDLIGAIANAFFKVPFEKSLDAEDKYSAKRRQLKTKLKEAKAKLKEEKTKNPHGDLSYLEDSVHKYDGRLTKHMDEDVILVPHKCSRSTSSPHPAFFLDPSFRRLIAYVLDEEDTRFQRGFQSRLHPGMVTWSSQRPQIATHCSCFFHLPIHIAVAKFANDLFTVDLINDIKRCVVSTHDQNESVDSAILMSSYLFALVGGTQKNIIMGTHEDGSPKSEFFAMDPMATSAWIQHNKFHKTVQAIWCGKAWSGMFDPRTLFAAPTYAPRTLELCLYAINKHSSFSDALYEVYRLGGIGCAECGFACGMLAGPLFRSIPRPWKDAVDRASGGRIRSVLTKFQDLLHGLALYSKYVDFTSKKILPKPYSHTPDGDFPLTEENYKFPEDKEWNRDDFLLTSWIQRYFDSKEPTMIPVRMGEEVVYRLLNRFIIFSPDENDLRLISNPDSKKLSKKDIKIAHEQGINERNIIYGVEKGLISLVKYVTPRSGRTQGVQLGLAPLNPEKCLKLLSKYSEFQKLGHNIRLKKPLPTGSHSL